MSSARGRFPSDDLPQLNIRLPVEVRQELEAAAEVLHRTKTQIVLDALIEYFDRLPAARRRRIRATLRSEGAGPPSER